MCDGYDHLTNHLAKDLDVKLPRKVLRVDHRTGGCIVTAAKPDGTIERTPAHSVVCTASVGVLKSGTIRFHPPLSTKKQQAIDHLDMGLENRVMLTFRKCFWAERPRVLRSTDCPRIKVYNTHALGSHDNQLLVFVPPNFSHEMERMTNCEVVREVLGVSPSTCRSRPHPLCKLRVSRVLLRGDKRLCIVSHFPLCTRPIIARISP